MFRVRRPVGGHMVSGRVIVPLKGHLKCAFPPVVVRFDTMTMVTKCDFSINRAEGLLFFFYLLSKYFLNFFCDFCF